MGKIESWGEIVIELFLDAYKVFYLQEYTFDDLKGLKNGKLRFDFAIFNKFGKLQFLLEYQGSQHFFPYKRTTRHKKKFFIQQVHDERKKRYCIIKNFNLETIDYNQDTLWWLKKYLEKYELELNPESDEAIEYVSEIHQKLEAGFTYDDAKTVVEHEKIQA